MHARRGGPAGEPRKRGRTIRSTREELAADIRLPLPHLPLPVQPLLCHQSLFQTLLFQTLQFQALAGVAHLVPRKSSRATPYRNYRGQRSHGMLCSLTELGWLVDGPNEVAVLRVLAVGQSLDHLLADDYPRVVGDWARVAAFAAGRRPAMSG